MPPPSKEGDQAISEHGNYPSTPTLENSIELLIISETNSHNRRNLIRKLLIEGYANCDPNVKQSTFSRFQDGLVRAISESKFFMVSRDKDKQFLAIKEEYILRLVDSFTFEIFFSENNPTYIDINKDLLKLVEERLRDIKTRKSFNDFEFDYKGNKRIDDFVRFAFSSNVDPQMSIIARLVLDIINQKAWANETRSDLIKDLITATNHLNPEVKKRFDNWRKASIKEI